MATKSGTMTRDIGEMATIGAAAFTLGSAFFDITRAFGVGTGPLEAPISQLTGQQEVGSA